MLVSATEVYRCSPQRYIEQYFDPEGRKRRMVDGCKGVSWELLDKTEAGGERRMRAAFVQRLDAPKAVQKLFGETSRFEEVSVWREGSDEIQVTLIPDKMTDRMSLQGRYRVQDAGDGTSRVTLEMEVQVKIFGVGGLVEKMAAKELPKTFAKDAEYFNAHLVG
jgi:hypothetical protein